MLKFLLQLGNGRISDPARIAQFCGEGGRHFLRKLSGTCADGRGALCNDPAREPCAAEQAEQGFNRIL